MTMEHDFARRNPALDKALREQIKAPAMDGAFRQQVFARIAAQRAELSRLAAAPDAGLARLRAQFVLQMLNLGAIGLVVALLLRAAWPAMTSFFAQWGLAAPVASLLQQGGLVLSMTVAGAALVYGLHRARLLSWMRYLE